MSNPPSRNYVSKQLGRDEKHSTSWQVDEEEEDDIQNIEFLDMARRKPKKASPPKQLFPSIQLLKHQLKEQQKQHIRSDSTRMEEEKPSLNSRHFASTNGDRSKDSFGGEKKVKSNGDQAQHKSPSSAERKPMKQANGISDPFKQFKKDRPLSSTSNSRKSTGQAKTHSINNGRIGSAANKQKASLAKNASKQQPTEVVKFFELFKHDFDEKPPQNQVQKQQQQQPKQASKSGNVKVTIHSDKANSSSSSNHIHPVKRKKNKSEGSNNNKCKEVITVDDSQDNYHSSECSIMPQGSNSSLSVMSLSNIASPFGIPQSELDEQDESDQQQQENASEQESSVVMQEDTDEDDGIKIKLRRKVIEIAEERVIAEASSFDENPVHSRSNHMNNTAMALENGGNGIIHHQVIVGTSKQHQHHRKISGNAADDMSHQSLLLQQSHELQDINAIVDEYYETSELPRDKTKFLWVMSCNTFCQKLNSSRLDSVLFKSGNGRTWRLEVQYNEKNEELICLVRGIIGDSGKSQVQVTVKMWVISESAATIERSGSSTKTFNKENDSHSFSFAFEMESLAQNKKYHHAVFEVSLQQLRLLSHNSKEETGYVGMLNEGMTCYINSFLQTLFHLKAFVRLVYSYPTSKTNEPTFPHTLQELFYQLQSWPYQCSTADLLKSFSWDRSRARIQQDVQEFSCLFTDFLEKKAEQIPKLKGQIKSLLQGKIQTKIRCIDVKYESVSEESFFDLSLNLLGCKDIYASLDDYVREEKLEGENKYDTGKREFQKQDAKKGTKLLTLPPVLFFHLKRFQYDQNSGLNMKITDQHKYYDEIDLRPYMAAPEINESYKYQLFAVLVHSGDMSQSGHYYAYIRPGGQRQWFKFNDAIVEKASAKQAFDNSFGGKVQYKTYDRSKKELTWESVAMNSTAYMLVYINVESIEEVLLPIEETAVPKWVLDAEEVNARESSLKEKHNKYIQVRMLTFEWLKKQRQACAVYFQKQTRRDSTIVVNENIIYKRDVERGRRFKEFYAELCGEFGLEVEDVTLWRIEYLANGQERITNETKRMTQCENDTVEAFYGEQSPSAVYLILPVNNSLRFAGNKALFQLSASNASAMVGEESEGKQVLEIRKELQVQKEQQQAQQQQSSDSATKKKISQNDWSRFFTFQEGGLMLIIIKTFEFTRTEGVRIQFMDYIFMRGEATFSMLVEETTKRYPQIGSPNFWKEAEYSVTELNLFKYGETPIRNVFNSVDAGVLMIPFESKLAKDCNISVRSFYQQLSDQVRVRFVFNAGQQEYVASNGAPIINGQYQSLQNKRINNMNHVDFNAVLGNVVEVEEIVAKGMRYSQLQALLMSSLKEKIKAKIEGNQEISEDKVNEMTRFLDLDNNIWSEYILLRLHRVRQKKSVFEDFPYFQTATSETSVSDLLKFFDGTVQLGFEFSRNLRAKERDNRIMLNLSFFSNSTQETLSNGVVEVEKNVSYSGLDRAIKLMSQFKELAVKEQTTFGSALTIKVCVLSRENPNRIEGYLTDSTKVATVKSNSLRVELTKSINEGDVLVICHMATRNGVEIFESPFGFGFSMHRSVKLLREFVLTMLENRSRGIVYDGKKVNVVKDAVVLVFSSEYSKYNGRKVVLEATNERPIKQEIDIESLLNWQAYLEIQFSSIVSPSDSKTLKFGDI